MSNFKTILVVLAVLLLACYMSIEYTRGKKKSSLSSSSSSAPPKLKKEGKSYKTHEDENENIPRVIQDMCHNVPIVDGEDCYKQLYPITLPYVDYKSDHVPPAFVNSPCIV